MRCVGSFDGCSHTTTAGGTMAAAANLVEMYLLPRGCAVVAGADLEACYRHMAVAPERWVLAAALIGGAAAQGCQYNAGPVQVDFTQLNNGVRLRPLAPRPLLAHR